ncbi:hypothetical protein [Rhodococcus sp. BUPNP1]|uniref:hypothetical protein n=1 Tax=Rhodococcus sp. BUPNP1 TaxID=1432786 RepID=UPI0015565652|nr:hypothetical protein [Rhodococcus sp. BUPNP1]
MKLITDACDAQVATAPAHHSRPILVRFAGLTIAMKPHEARTLADRLHDAADQAEETQQ